MNKLVDQYNNTYHHSINKDPMDADYSALTEKIETNSKALEFKVNYRVRTIIRILNTKVSGVEKKNTRY